MVTPVTNHRRISDSVLNEHALRLGHSQEELVKCFFVVLAQRTKAAFRTVFELDLARKFLEFVFERHSFGSVSAGILTPVGALINFEIPSSRNPKSQTPNPTIKAVQLLRPALEN